MAAVRWRSPWPCLIEQLLSGTEAEHTFCLTLLFERRQRKQLYSAAKSKRVTRRKRRRRGGEDKHAQTHTDRNQRQTGEGRGEKVLETLRRLRHILSYSYLAATYKIASKQLVLKWSHFTFKGEVKAPACDATRARHKCFLIFLISSGGRPSHGLTNPPPSSPIPYRPHVNPRAISALG